MTMPNGKWICVRDCYYLRRYWYAGESLNDTAGFEDAPPGKHFAIDGIIERDATSEIVRPGDDPRSTAQIREDLLLTHSIEAPDDANRRTLFAMWVEAEREAERAAAPARASESQPAANAPVSPSEVAGAGNVDPLGTRRFSDLQPDELDSLKSAEIADAVLTRYGVDMKWRGRPKATLIQEALQLEAHA